MDKGFTLTAQGMEQLCCQNNLHNPRYLLNHRTSIEDTELSTFKLIDRLFSAGWQQHVLEVGARASSRPSELFRAVPRGAQLSGIPPSQKFAAA